MSCAFPQEQSTGAKIFVIYQATRGLSPSLDSPCHPETDDRIDVNSYAGECLAHARRNQCLTLGMTNVGRTMIAESVCSYWQRSTPESRGAIAERGWQMNSTRLLRKIVACGMSAVGALSIALDSSADGQESAKSSLRCKQSDTTLTPSKVVEIAKKEIGKREPIDPYKDIDARFDEELCGWIVVATRTPQKPGAARHLLISKDGKLREYLPGF
jgi:hypothetical protein